MENQERTQLNRETLMDMYSDYVLSENKRPLNVYKFAKEHGFEEGDFYKIFASFLSLEREYFIFFFNKSLDLTKKTEGYGQMEPKEKLLSFYYIFTENLSMNRSLVLFLLKDRPDQRIRKLKGLKESFLSYVQDLGLKEKDWLDKLPKRLQELQLKKRENIFWLHLLSIIKFWQNDSSAGFEQTDAYIEKSVDVGFTAMESSLFDKVFDLGKFLWHERF